MAKKESKETPETFVVFRRKEYETVVGGAVWKIAYADFVTAMMAFYLLLWLTSTLTQEQAAGIADYFSPVTDAIQSDEAKSLQGLTFDPENVMYAVLTAPNPTEQTPNFGGERAGDRLGEERTSQEETDIANADIQSAENAERHRLEAEGQNYGASLSQNPRLRELRKSFTVEDTPLGVRVDLIDLNRDIIFTAPDSAELTDHGRRFLAQVFSAIVSQPNDIIIVGHAQDAAQLKQINPTIDVWRLSLDRGLAVFRWLEYLGFPTKRIRRIDGRADTLNHRMRQEGREQEQNRVSLYLLALDPPQAKDIARPISNIKPEDILRRSLAPGVNNLAPNGSQLAPQ